MLWGLMPGVGHGLAGYRNAAEEQVFLLLVL